MRRGAVIGRPLLKMVCRLSSFHFHRGSELRHIAGYARAQRREEEDLDVDRECVMTGFLPLYAHFIHAPRPTIPPGPQDHIVHGKSPPRRTLELQYTFAPPMAINVINLILCAPPLEISLRRKRKCRHLYDHLKRRVIACMKKCLSRNPKERVTAKGESLHFGRKPFSLRFLVQGIERYPSYFDFSHFTYDEDLGHVSHNPRLTS